MLSTLYIHTFDDYTGSTRVLASLLEQKKEKCSVLVIPRNGFLSQTENVHIYPIYYPTYKQKHIPFISGLVSRLYAIIWLLINGWKFDIFYINTICPYYAAVVGRLYRKQIVYHIHEYFVKKDRQVRIAEYVFNHVKAKHIYVSKYLQHCYSPQNECTEMVTYNTLPISFCRDIVPLPLEERKRDTIIMVSSLSVAKGIFTFIEIARRLPEYNFKLVISSSMLQIQCFIAKKIALDTLPINLQIYSSQSDIRPLLYQSDLIVNLSIPELWIETFGMTILEAMPFGIPAIVPNVGGPIEIVENGYNGYCVDVLDVDRIVILLRHCLEKSHYQQLMLNTLLKYESLKSHEIDS